MLSVNCPACQAPVSQEMKECPFCGKPIVVTSFKDVRALSNLELNKYQSSYNRNISAGKGNQNNNEISLAFIFLKLKMYDKANIHFDKAIESNFENSELFFAASISKLCGKKAFLNMRPTINEAERLINIAIEIEPRGIYYYFLAYLRYDYHYRKSFNVSPNYRQYFDKAVSIGISRHDIDVMYEMLGVSCPDEIRL